MPDHADPTHAGGVHHLELNASDLEAAVDFWDWILCALGYEPKAAWEGGRSWTNGATYVVVVAAGTAGPFDREAPGLNHVAFHAPTRDQVDRLATELRERTDATLLFPDQHPYAGGYYALYCEGPDGVKVEVVGPEAA